MSLVSNPIDALFNGVSQQPASMRLPSQCEEQINCYASVADGLTKRPPTEHLATLTASQWGDAFVHIINRDISERYAVVITDEVLKVYDLADGVEQTVIHEHSSSWAATTAYVRNQLVRPSAANGLVFRCTTAGTSDATEPTWDTTIGNTTADATVVWETIDNYFSLPVGADARETFEVVTVADYSFIVNKTKTVLSREMETATHSGYAEWFFPDNWQRSGEDSRYYYPTIGADKGKVQTMSELPLLTDTVPPVNADFYEIAGGNDGDFSKFYVIFQSGVWNETHANNDSIAIDEASMPHALVRESDGDFHVREFAWIPRLFGDSVSNPVPSFINKKITDIGFHKNRLVISAGENVVFSGAGDYGNFFRNTVTQLLDSDVVDVAVSTQEVATVNYLLPAENGMMFFSDQHQFLLNVDQLLTPSTVSVDIATSYEMNPNVKPISVGQDVYFVTETGDFSRVREYTLTGGNTVETDADDITAHVPRYIPKNVHRLAGNSNEDLMLALTSDNTNRVYPYKFFYSGGDKVQSSWSYWQFATDDVILDINILNNTVFMVVERADGVFLETMNVQSTDFPLALTFDILLDRRYQFAGVDKAWNGTETAFELPYTLTAAEQADFRLVTGDGATPGRLLDPDNYTWIDSSHVKFIGDWTGVEMFGGLVYTSTYTLSEQFHKGRDGSAVTTGRYQLRTITVVFEDMAFFKTTVDPYGTGSQSVTEEIVTAGLIDFTGKTLGTTSLTLGSPTFEDGTYDFQIYGNSKVAEISFTNDVPFGGKMVSATVEGFYTRRGR